MKKIVLALTVALMGTIVMNAQPSRHHDMNPEQMVEKRVERLDKALALTAEQRAEITRIYSEEMKDNHKAKPQRMDKGERPDEATMAAHREQMKAQRESTDAKVKALLTPEQAARMASCSDGAIVGSAIIRLISRWGKDAAPEVGKYIRSMKEAVEAAGS